MNTTTKTRVAAVQMVSGPVVADNLKEAGHWIAEAARQGAQLVALPEYFPLISGDEADKIGIREAEGEGPIQRFLADCARRHGIWLIGGSVPLVADAANKVRNTCLAFGPDGSQVARYDKVHLFAFTRGAENYDEARTIEAGHQPVSIETPFGRVGLSICYDLRFPEYFRALGDMKLLVLGAAFTETTGRAHWELLLRARAVENQCYVLAAAQGGVHPSGRRTWGDSMLIDPWGNVINRLARGPGVVVGDLDSDYLVEIRQNLPALGHRRIAC
ncbi:carbon-nitrogen hydrolase family protein [Methyloversatilis discipulorum]|uniref:carbon-nitrogen hydrolase family protein n=1 Tax=Methyloversatilis discipulorum TaxID=1119528 RepID=UPI001A5E2CE7|nr:carbon-nitrogen hydrolase family protein [Methyloversatilis discipulorum]MBL8467304.1 carbon-nitrogen hydrolase family protein [Methyloversatilis discipulorum]